MDKTRSTTIVQRKHFPLINTIVSQNYCEFVNIQNPDDYAFRSKCTSTKTAENTVKVYNFPEDCNI